MITIDLSGKVVLLTGGSRGIGAAIATYLLQSKATLALHYNTSEAPANVILEGNKSNGLAFQADLTNPKEVKELFRQVIATYGHIDILINNAGMALFSDPEKDADSWFADWQRTMMVNLAAPALLCKMALPSFITQGHGIIINISSRAAHRGDTKEYLAYASSKGGLESLTKSLARAYGKQGIVVYGVAPGFTRTEMAEDFIRTYGEEYALNDIALSELTTPEDIAPLIAFLASGAARHATGTTIDINAASYVR